MLYSTTTFLGPRGPLIESLTRLSVNYWHSRVLSSGWNDLAKHVAIVTLEKNTRQSLHIIHTSPHNCPVKSKHCFEEHWRLFQAATWADHISTKQKQTKAFDCDKVSCKKLQWWFDIKTLYSREDLLRGKEVGKVVLLAAGLHALPLHLESRVFKMERIIWSFKYTSEITKK